VVALAGPVWAGEPPSDALGFIRDLGATNRAQRALDGDKSLAPLRLKVKVHDGVAEVSGQSPSDEAARRAVGKLYTVRGVVEVRARIALTRPAPAPAARSGTPDERQVVKSAKPVTNGGSDTAIPPPAPKPVPPAVTVSQVKQPTLRDRVETVRSSDTHFQGIFVEVRAGNLLVHPGEADPKFVNAFCQALEDGIPGVMAMRTSR
jgi:hypothetical protein